MPLKVFLSSTLEDLKAERHAAADAIRSLKDFECLLVEEEPPSTLPAEELVRHLIEKSDIFLMILGTRRGTESPQSTQSWTRVEYEMVRTARKPIMVFVQNSLESGSVEDLQEAILSHHLVDRFDTPKELKQQIVNSLLRWAADDSGDFEIVFAPQLSSEQIQATLEALASAALVPCQS